MLGSFPSLNQTSLIKAPRVSSVAGEYNDDARKQRREASLKCVLAMRLVNARILHVWNLHGFIHHNGHMLSYFPMQCNDTIAQNMKRVNFPYRLVQFVAPTEQIARDCCRIRRAVFRHSNCNPLNYGATCTALVQYFPLVRVRRTAPRILTGHKSKDRVSASLTLAKRCIWTWWSVTMLTSSPIRNEVLLAATDRDARKQAEPRRGVNEPSRLKNGKTTHTHAHASARRTMESIPSRGDAI